MQDEPNGKTIDRYEIRSLIEKGPLGTVYLGFDPKLDREVAIRVLDPEYSRPGPLRERLLLEARAAVRWKHPGIARIYDFGEANAQFFLVSEYLPGSSLRKFLIELKARDQAVDFSESLRVAYRIAEALDFAHQRGMIHGNLHPANIILRSEPGDEPPFQPVLLDLGIPKAEPDEIPLELFPYRSPERVHGDKQYHSDDLYALGVILYEMAVGELPAAVLQGDQSLCDHVRAIPPRVICPEMPAALETVILKSIAERSSDRYPNARSLMSAAADARRKIDPASSPLDKEISSALMATFEHSLEEAAKAGSSATQIFTPETEPRPARAGAVLKILEPNHTMHTAVVKPVGTTIGRDPSNDVVINHPRVSRFHARVNFDGKQYIVTDLNSTNGTFLGQARLEPNKSYPWSEEIRLRIGDTWINLSLAQETEALEATASDMQKPGISQTATAIAQPDARSHRIDFILETPNMTVIPGKKKNGVIRLINQSSEPDQFRIVMQGVPSEWLKDLPPTVSLAAREEREIQYSIEPPKNSTARAGRHPYSLKVSSLKAPDQMIEQKGSLTVQAFTQFDCEIQPKEIRGSETGQLKLRNTGNVPETFTVMWNDKGSRLVFEPPAVKITVPPGETAIAEFRASLKATRWFGKEQVTPYAAHISSASGQIQTHAGQFASMGLLPVWAPPAFLSVCLVLACIGALLSNQFFPALGGSGRQATRTAAYEFTQVALMVSSTMQAATGTSVAIGSANQATRDAATATAVWRDQDDDRDRLANGKELELGTLPNKLDTDEDLLNDGDEVGRGTNPLKADTDGDGISDGTEVIRGINPMRIDTDNDGIADAADPDPGRAPTLTPSPIPTLTRAPSSTPSPTLTRAPSATATSTHTVTPSASPTASPVPPGISGLNPSVKKAGEGDFQLTVNGSNFTGGMVVRWNGSNRPTFFTNANQIVALIAKEDILSAGTYQISVSNPATGQTSPVFNISVTNPAPALSGIAPPNAFAGGDNLNLTLNGSNFIKASKVRVNGADRATFYNNANTLTAVITSADIASGGDLQITVFNPTPEGGTSAAQILKVSYPDPEIAAISPLTATEGTVGLTLTITGTGFTVNSVIVFDGEEIKPTQFLSNKVLKANIPANLLQDPTTVQVRVHNPAPGGGDSGNKPFVIERAPADGEGKPAGYFIPTDKKIRWSGPWRRLILQERAELSFSY